MSSCYSCKHLGMGIAGQGMGCRSGANPSTALRYSPDCYVPEENESNEEREYREFLEKKQTTGE